MAAQSEVRYWKRALDAGEVERFVAEWLNCEFVEIDVDGEVWVEKPMVGHWLKQERLLEFVDFMRQRGY